MNRPPASSRPTWLALVFLLAACVALGAGRADAQATEQPQPSETYEGWYVVRPGDTLQGLTERYLGDASRWRENWRLNPEIGDPDRIAPGLRLKILLRRLPRDGALVTRVSNRVEDQMPPRTWDSTDPNTVLRPRDSVRTFEASSAALRFGDETDLLISEESLIFLDREVIAGPRPTRREQIEIVVGQADLARPPRGSAPSDDDGGDDGDDGEIELVVGAAMARPTAAASGEMATRARTAGDDAQLMVYTGESRLSAAGVEIDVPEGMGSAVAEGEPPGPPEQLLDAPATERPRPGDRLATPRPTFSWRAVDGAAGYTVEICRDADCGALVLRAVLDDAAATAWQPAPKLPKDDLHWRVTARSPSGLDGYPSDAVPFTVLTDREDTEPPRVAFRVDGPHLPPRPHLNERWILGPGAGLVAIAEDAGSGVDRLVMELDGRQVEPAAWQGPWEPGEHRLAFTAFDRAGQTTRHGEIPIVYDVEPPATSWGVETLGRLGEVTRHGLDAGSVGAWTPPPVKRVIEVDDPHSWLPWRKQRWTVFHDGRHVLLRPAEALVLHLDEGFGDAEPVLLGPRRGLWIRLLDEVCRDDFLFEHELVIDTRRGGGNRRGKRSVLSLELRAVDAVGNGLRAELSMTSAEASREERRALAADATGAP